MSRPTKHPVPECEQDYYIPPRRKSMGIIVPMLLVATGVLLFCCGFLLGNGRTVPNMDYPHMETPAPVISRPPQKDDTVDIQDGTNHNKMGWNLVLVNAEKPLPEDFQLPELTQLRNGQSIDSRAYPALQRMMDAARAEGLQPLICSSYRTWNNQRDLFLNKVQWYLDLGHSAAQAEEKAAQWIARPGTSEHQLGLAVDIVDIGYQLLDEQQENTPVQQWLMSHCAEYGFILRYPTDKSHITGIKYEPWHYRYVGEEAAREIMEQGLCLEEYLSQ